MSRQAWLTWLALCSGGLVLAGSAHRLFAQQVPAEPADQSAPASAPPAIPSDWVPRIRLLAGDGHVGLQDGPAAQARFADPYGMALDAEGRLYVADAGDNNRIRRHAARDGVVSARWPVVSEGFVRRHRLRGRASTRPSAPGTAMPKAISTWPTPATTRSAR